MVTEAFIVTGISVEVVRDGFLSTDDIGVFLRGHHLVEQAADGACRALYENYAALRHDTLRKHLSALEARGAVGPMFVAARIVGKHRDDFAHTRSFVVPDEHVRKLEASLKSSGQQFPFEKFVVPQENGNVLPYPSLRPAHRYFTLCVMIAGSIEHLGKQCAAALTTPVRVHVGHDDG